MSKQLATLYSQVYALALDLSLANFLNKKSLNIQTLTFNKKLIDKLMIEFLPLLQLQNMQEPSGLSLELEHLLVVCSKTLNDLCSMDTDAHETGIWNIQCSNTYCHKHALVQLQFCNNLSITVKLDTITSIEQFFRKLNYVFSCLTTENAIKTLQKDVIPLLFLLRDIGPIPLPETYQVDASCLECIHENELLPNQGDSTPTVQSNKFCPHVCPEITPEPIEGLFEHELKNLNINVSLTNKDLVTGTSDVMSTNIHKEKLSQCNIFSAPSVEQMQISTLLYWTSGQKISNIKNNQICSELTRLFKRDELLHIARKQLFPETCNGHFFDLYKPSTPLERLFCGCLFSSNSDLIYALKHDFSTAFNEKHSYNSILRNQNELYQRLSDMLHSSQSKPETNSVKVPMSLQMYQPIECPDSKIIADARSRKEHFFSKILSKGLTQLTSCLDQHTLALKQFLTPRIWGSLVFSQAAILLNHFLTRIAILRQVHLYSASLTEQQEHAKFIKSNMYKHTLSKEQLDSLSLTYFRLITGPLSMQTDMFPLPHNVALAQCLEAAGVLPHHKITVSQFTSLDSAPLSWISTDFNNFFALQGTTLSELQESVLTYVRELVLAVALYNSIWEHPLNLYSVLDLSPSQASANNMSPGVYLTYETSAPLVLVSKAQSWLFKDIYSMLYCHLHDHF